MQRKHSAEFSEQGRNKTLFVQTEGVEKYNT